MLSPITYLEESSGAAIRVCINEIEFNVPTSWFIMVADPDTYQLDTVPIGSCSSTVYHAISMSPDDSRYRLLPISIIDFVEETSCIHPMIQKGHGMQHPVGITYLHEKRVNLTVTVGPHDLYKFIEGLAVGDIF